MINNTLTHVTSTAECIQYQQPTSFIFVFAGELFKGVRTHSCKFECFDTNIHVHSAIKSHVSEHASLPSRLPILGVGGHVSSFFKILLVRCNA